MNEEHDSSDLRSAAIHGLRWTALVRPLSEIALLASMVVLARLIPPAEFGHFAIVIIVGELAVFITSEGVGTALVQQKEVTRRHLQAGFALTLIAGVLLAGLMLLLAATVFTWLFDERTADFVRLTIPAILISGIATVPCAVLRRRLAFKTLGIIDVATSATRGIVSVALALAGLEGEALILGGTVAAVVTTGIAWASAPIPLPRLRRKETREILDYGLPAALASVSWVGFRNCDYAIVGARLGAVPAGLYFRAYVLAIEYQKKVSMVMGSVGFPLLARARDPKEFDRLRVTMVHVLTVVLFPPLTLLAIMAPVLVPWLFGDAWTPAVVPTQVLAIGGASTLVIDAVGATLQAQGRARALLGYGYAHFAAYAVAVLIATSIGITAVAVAASVVHTAFLIVAYVLMLRGTKERTFATLWKDVAPAGVSSLFLLAVALPLSLALTKADVAPFLQLVAIPLAALPAYLLALRLCFPAIWDSMFKIAKDVLPTQRLRPRRWRLAPAEGG